MYVQCCTYNMRANWKSSTRWPRSAIIDQQSPADAGWGVYARTPPHRQQPRVQQQQQQPTVSFRQILAGARHQWNSALSLPRRPLDSSSEKASADRSRGEFRVTRKRAPVELEVHL